MTVFAIYPVMQNALTILWWWFFDWWLFGRWLFNRRLGLVFIGWWFGWLCLGHIGRRFSDDAFARIIY